MTKINRSWREQLPGAFAFRIAPFAGHPLDEQRAVEMFHAALREGATEEEIIAAAVTYLKERKCPKDEIDRQVARIRSFKPRPTAKVNSSRAWLVTLESHDKKPLVISVFKALRSPTYVREYMEQYYIDNYYSVREKLLYAKSRKNNPYPAVFELLDNVPWQGRITCGHNPFLFGRLVRKLRIVDGPNGEELAWEELPIPQHPLSE